MPRRGENIYKRKDGRWEGRFIQQYDKTGRAVYKSVYAASYAEVRKKLSGFKMTHNGTDCKSSKNIDNFAEEWLKAVKIRCKPSTLCTYENNYRLHIKPVIGNICPDVICTEHIEKIISEAEKLSPKTKSDILCILKQLFSFINGKGEDIIALKNWCIKIPDKQMRVLSESEQNILTAFITDKSDLCAMGIYLSLYTGIRIGELCALKRDNIDLENKILKVRQTMLRVQIPSETAKTKVIIMEPKTKKAVRDIPLPGFIAEYLYECCKDMDRSAFLLTGRSDKYREPRYMQYKFKSYINKAGIKDANFHSLRHTFATRCVEAGFDIKTLSEILGHADVNITLSRYVHSSVDLKRRNMEKLCSSVK